MANALDRVPGLAGYFGTEEQTREQNAATLSNAVHAQGLRQALYGMQQEQGARQALSQLGPDATPDQIAGAVLPYSGVQGALRYADVKQRVAAQRDLGLARLTQAASQFDRRMGVEDRKARLRALSEAYGLPADLADKALEIGGLMGGNAAPPQEGVANLGGKVSVIPNDISDEDAIAAWKASGAVQNPSAPGQATPPQAGAPAQPVGAPVARGEQPPVAMPTPAPVAPPPAAAQGAPVARGIPQPPPELEAEWAKLSRKERDKKRADWIAKNIPVSEAQLSEPALKIAGWEKLLFGTDPKGLGKASAQQRAQVMDERARIAKSLGLSDEEAAMLPFDNKTKQKAIGNLVQWGAFVGKAQEQLEKSLDLAIDYAKKLNPMTLQTVNRAIIAGRKEFNDPIANAYALQIQTVRTEYGRLMAGPTSNGMLPVEALKKGDDLISKGSDVPTLQEMKKVMVRDAQITKNSVDNQVNGLRSTITNPLGRNQAKPPEDMTAMAKDAWGSYEPDKYEYRINDGKIQRRPK